jgi:citrate lyase subunit beta/citryl-CoA lyase
MKYRSVLFVPGCDEKKIKKAYTLSADLIVLDLESTVPENKKEIAKNIIRNLDLDKSKTYIRINSNNDLDFVTQEKFIGIFLPFTESEIQLLKINNELKNLETLKTDIIPIIESQEGLNNLRDICNFKERVKLISFGSHDLTKSLNLKVSDNEEEILIYRQVIAKNSYKPIDTSYLNYKDLDGFKESCILSKHLGFGGKACIHPDQINIANDIFF